MIHRALAASEGNLGWLSRHGFIRENPNPHLAAALDVVGNGTARGLDLARRDPGPFLGFEAKTAEGKMSPAGFNPAASPLEPFSMFYLFRLQHTLSDQDTVTSEQDRRCHSLLTVHYSLFILTLILLEHFALIDPHLDANDAVGGVRFDERVINRGAERL